jgi:hypothetical protein
MDMGSYLTKRRIWFMKESLATINSTDKEPATTEISRAATTGLCTRENSLAIKKWEWVR